MVLYRLSLSFFSLRLRKQLLSVVLSFPPPEGVFVVFLPTLFLMFQNSPVPRERVIEFSMSPKSHNDFYLDFTIRVP